MASKHTWVTKIAANDSTAKEQVGALRREWNTTDSCFKTFRYVHNQTGTAVANGMALSFMDATMGTVTSDITESGLSATNFICNKPAGVGRGAITGDYYGWIQTGGYHSAVQSTPTISDGASIILHSSVDGHIDHIASGTAPICRPLGIAVAASSGSAVASFLTLDEAVQ